MRATAESVLAGNAYDKYGTGNPVARRLVSRFTLVLDELIATADPESLVDVGCGEGVLTSRWAERLAGRRVVGVDLKDSSLRAEWERHKRSNVELRAGDALALPFADGELDMAAAVEVLEHLREPERALAELARVARRHLLLSVPREPIWRAANLARGAYVRSLGNTLGHVNHWSSGAFASLVEPYGDVVATRSPFPWSVLLVRLHRAT